MPQAELRGVLSCNNKPFINSMNESVAKGKTAGREITGAFSGIGKTLTGVGASMVAAFSVGAVVAAGKSVLEFAGNLQDAADALGFNITTLQGYSGAMAKSGVSSEKFAKGIGKLTQNIIEARDGSAPMIASFERLGISLSDIKTDDPSEVLLKISDALKDSGNSAESFAAALSILGKSGYGMIASLKQGREEFVKQAEAVAKLTPDEVARLDAIGDAFTNLGIRAKTGAGKAIAAIAEWDEARESGEVLKAARVVAAEAFRTTPYNSSDAPNKITTNKPSIHEVLRARRQLTADRMDRRLTEFQPQSGATANPLAEQAASAMEAMRGDAKNKEKIQDEEADRVEKMQEDSAKNERDLDAANAMARMTNLRNEIESGNKLYMDAEAERITATEKAKEAEADLDADLAAAKKKQLQDDIEAGNKLFMKEGYKGGAFIKPNDVLQAGMRERDKVFGAGSKFGTGISLAGSTAIQGSGAIQGAIGGLNSKGTGSSAYGLVRRGDAARAKAERANAGRDPMLSKTAAVARNTAALAKAFGVGGTEDA